MAAATRPTVVFPWRPTAEWAPDAGAGGFVARVLSRLAIQNDGLVILDGAHARLPRSRATAAASKLRSGIRESQN
jgi:hypothetical protein